MKTVVIGDIHGNPIWKDIVNKENRSKFIFVGDYFDSFVYSQKKCLKNYLEIIEFKKSNMDNVILLFGNHDFHYLSSVNETYKGYKSELSFLIEEYLIKHINSDLLQMAYQFDNFLFTHAGVTKTWFSNLQPFINETISDTINCYFKSFDLKNFKFKLGVNKSKDGNDITQSPIWVRLSSLHEDGVDNFIQIVGHTSKPEIYISDIVCIDTLNQKENLQSIIKDKQKEFKKNTDETRNLFLLNEIISLKISEQKSKIQYLTIVDNKLIIENL